VIRTRLEQCLTVLMDSANTFPPSIAGKFTWRMTARCQVHSGTDAVPSSRRGMTRCLCSRLIYSSLFILTSPC